jgi:hypothetical protein
MRRIVNKQKGESLIIKKGRAIADFALFLNPYNSSRSYCLIKLAVNAPDGLETPAIRVSFCFVVSSNMARPLLFPFKAPHDDILMLIR